MENKCTVREAAKAFELSKSTLHKDLSERLPEINKQLYLRIKDILDFNLAERHLRGGEATKKKYNEKMINEKL